jgi:hypothetical protein
LVDLHHDAGLFPKEVGQELSRGTEGLTRPHRRPEAINRSQWPGPGADQEVGLNAQAHRRDIGRLEGGGEEDIMDYRQEDIAVLLYPGRTIGLVERLIETLR